MARPYELKRRAERQAETRQKIVQAAVTLHSTIGPAKTTVSAIAELAGVERKTFYRHFPDADDVFQACSAHFRAHNPSPDPQDWLAIEDPTGRLRHGLAAMYDYYRRHERLMANVLRDRELGIPVGDGFLRFRAAAKSVLAQGFGDTAQRPETNAALDLALDFHAWRVLAHASLTDDQARDLACALVEASVR